MDHSRLTQLVANLIRLAFITAVSCTPCTSKTAKYVKVTHVLRHKSSDSFLSLVDIFIDISISSKRLDTTMVTIWMFRIMSFWVVSKIDLKCIHMGIRWYDRLVDLQHYRPLPPKTSLKIRLPLWVCKTIPKPSLYISFALESAFVRFPIANHLESYA